MMKFLTLGAKSLAVAYVMCGIFILKCTKLTIIIITSFTIFDFVIFCQLHIMMGWDQTFFCTKLVI